MQYGRQCHFGLGLSLQHGDCVIIIAANRLIPLYNHPQPPLQMFFEHHSQSLTRSFLWNSGKRPSILGALQGVFGVSCSGGGFLQVARGSQGGAGGPTTSQLQSPATLPADSSTLQKTGLKSVSHSQCLSLVLAASRMNDPPPQ